MEVLFYVRVQKICPAGEEGEGVRSTWVYIDFLSFPVQGEGAVQGIVSLILFYM